MFLKIATINSNHGLPNEQVHAIDQDKYGRLWTAGPAGLACYNGKTIKIYNSQSGLECQGLRTVSISQNGTVWIGTDRGIEALDIRGNKIHLQFSFDWLFGIAECILVNQSILWAGTSYGLLKLNLTGDMLELLSMEEMGLVRDIKLKDAEHILAISGKYGLIEHNGESWKQVNERLPSSDQVTCITKTLDNYLLVGSVNGLYILNDSYDIIELFSMPDQSKKVTALAIKGDEWWIAFGHILVYATPGINQTKLLDYENIGSKIIDLFIDQDGNTWVGTNNAGLKKISCLRKSIHQLKIPGGGSGFSIKAISHKNILLITGDGFCSIINPESDHSALIIKNILDIPTIVWDACMDPLDEKKVWIASENGLYCSTDGETFREFMDDNKDMASPNRVLLTRNDEIWLGTISGLFKIINNEVKEIFTDTGIRFGYVYTLALDQNENLWVGTLGQGLWKENGRRFVCVNSEHVSEKGNVYSLLPDQLGNMLVIHESKVLLLDQSGNSSLIIQEFPIAGWCSAWINETLMCTGSNDGIIIIDIEKKAIVQRINLLLDKSDWQFTSAQAIYVHDDKKLYCGLNSGIYVIDYNSIQHFNKTPVVYLNEIIWQNISPQKKDSIFKIPVGKWSVSISVYAAWFIDEHQVQFRHKLVGFDETWSELKEIPVIRYSSLPPGKYVLISQAFTNLSGFGEINEVMTLEVYGSWFKFGLNPVFEKINDKLSLLFKSRRLNKRLLNQNKDLLAEINERKLIENQLKSYKAELEEIVEHRTQDLKIQKERAESADKMKSAFLANMSHEIRTPLGVVIGLNQLLQKTSVDEIQADYLKKMESSAQHLLQVINDILDITKIESGKVEIEQETFSLQHILDELSGFVQVNSKVRPLDFEIENNVPDVYYLIGDPLKVKQVLINLLSNALKFTEEGKVKLSINQYDEKGINYLSFSVTDTGMGMTEQQMKNLFQAFTQAESGISRRFGGTGLGLNISYKFVELMGGELKVKSQLNKGSEFYFSLPLIISNDKIVKTDKTAQLLKQPIYPMGFENIRKAKILIAEDEVLIQFILQKVLEPEGFEIKTVNNGKQCIDILQKDPFFDLVLMDIQMPDMDGFAATRYIRNELKNDKLKIIGISANAFTETKENILSAGMNDFLSKPINMNELFKLMVKWINPGHINKGTDIS